jgi:hypothetical protein
MLTYYRLQFHIIPLLTFPRRHRRFVVRRKTQRVEAIVAGAPHTVSASRKCCVQAGRPIELPRTLVGFRWRRGRGQASPSPYLLFGMRVKHYLCRYATASAGASLGNGLAIQIPRDSRLITVITIILIIIVINSRSRIVGNGPCLFQPRRPRRRGLCVRERSILRMQRVPAERCVPRDSHYLIG